jgi:hypothetical protein
MTHRTKNGRMALLDFLKNRNQTQHPVAQTAQRPKPETAKQMYTREAAVEKATQGRVAALPDAQRARALGVGALINKATQHMHESRAQSAQPGDGMDNQAAMRQNMTGQERHSEALSPTGGHMGKTANERRPMNTPSQGREKTLPRTSPSWER